MSGTFSRDRVPDWRAYAEREGLTLIVWVALCWRVFGGRP